MTQVKAVQKLSIACLSTRADLDVCRNSVVKYCYAHSVNISYTLLAASVSLYHSHCVYFVLILGFDPFMQLAILWSL